MKTKIYVIILMLVSFSGIFFESVDVQAATSYDFKITYKDGSNSTTQSFTDKKPGSKITIKGASTFTKTGYTINCWREKSLDSDIYFAPGSSVEIMNPVGGIIIGTGCQDSILPSNTTLIAEWKPNQYTVSFNLNGGTLLWGNTTTNVTYDKPYGNPGGDFASLLGVGFPTVTKEGYTLTGWKLSNGTIVNENTIVKTAANHTLTAQWTPNKYGVSFNSNGGTSVTAKQVTFDSAYGTLAAPTRTGYKFAGWKLGSTTITSATIVKTAANHTLVAQWTPNKYNVSFNSNGGTSVTAKQVTFDSAYGALAAPTRTGYTFAGWKLGNTAITSTTVVKTAADHTLIAQWSPNRYSVNFDSQGGSAVSPIQVYFDSQYGALPIPTRTGYTFVNWKLNGNVVKATTILKTAKNHTLVAEWKAKSYEFQLESKGGTCNEKTMTLKYDSTYEGLPICEKPGYQFLYWSFTEDGSKKINPTDIVKVTKGVTLYAQYKVGNYTIKLDPQNGEECQNISVTYGDKMSLPNVKRKGYRFVGWFDKKTGGNKYISGLVVKIVSDSVFYAQWEPAMVAVVFDYRDGTTSPESRSVAYGQKYPEVKMPNRPGYVFKGWKINKTNTMVSEKTVVSLDEKHYLCAEWEKDTNYVEGVETVVQSGKLKVKCKKVKGAKGYQFALSTSKKFKKSKKGYLKKVIVKKNKTTFKGLKKNQTYYFKYRSYKKAGSKKKWSKWSKVKKISVN